MSSNRRKPINWRRTLAHWWRWLLRMVAVAGAGAALWLIFDLDGLRTLATLGLFGGWTIGVAVYAYHKGADAGYRKSRQLPPPEMPRPKAPPLGLPDPWEILRQHQDQAGDPREQHDKDQPASGTDAPRPPMNAF